MAEVVRQRSPRSALGGQQAGITRTWDDVQATFVRAGVLRAGLSSCKVAPAAGQHDATPPPALVHLSKQSRRQSGRLLHGGSKGCSPGDGKGRATDPDTAAAKEGSAGAWVWGQESAASPATTAHKRQQDTKGVVAAGAGVTAGDDEEATKNASVGERKKMFAEVASSSSCSTVDLTASESGSNKANSPTCVAALDDSFWNQLSDISGCFPEPPTRVPTPASSTSTALAISGWGKNITSTLPSVQVLLPSRWRKRLRSVGSQKRCRKSTSRWIARSKATGSMSEKCVFARAVSISDGTSLHHRQRREKDMGAAVVAVSHESAPAAVSHEPASPAVAPAIEAVAEEEPSEVAEVAEKSAPAAVALAADKEEEQQPRPQQPQHQHQEREEQQPQPQQQQREDQQQEAQQQQQEHRAVPSALPTPADVHAPPSMPPPAPLWTAPRPPLSRQQTPLAARYPLRRTARYFGSISSQGSARENRMPPSPFMTTSRMTMKNRLASSGSSIFEEDGDDSKKTKWLNPYTLSPAAPGAAPARATVAAAPTAAASKPCVCAPAPGTGTAPLAPEAGKGTGTSPCPPSPAWVWEGRSPRATHAAGIQQQQMHQQQMQQQQQQQQQPSVFVTGAGWGRRRRDAAVRALAIEINRRDALIYGDQRRRMKNGESGIWLPSPGIWSSGRRPTPLSSDVFHAW